MWESWRHAGRNGEMEQKRTKNKWMKEGCCGEQRRWEGETDCQEVEKPADKDHDEGMDSEGLGMACEKSGGEEGYLFCLLIEIQDAWSQPCCSPTGFLFFPPSPSAPPSLCLPPSLRSLLDLRLCCRSSPFVPRRFLPLSLSCRNLRCVALLQSFRIRLRLH